MEPVAGRSGLVFSKFTLNYNSPVLLAQEFYQ